MNEGVAGGPVGIDGDMTGSLRTHREIAEAVADDVASGGPDADYTLHYLMAGMIHGLLAVVDVMEDLQDTLAEGQGQ